jgi:hypothetical protein
MQRLDVSCAVRRTYTSLGAKGLNTGVLKFEKKKIRRQKVKTLFFLVVTYTLSHNLFSFCKLYA